MILWFYIALIAFLGLAVIYHRSIRRRFSKRRYGASGTSPKAETTASPPSARKKIQGRYVDIVGIPHTDLSIYYRPKRPKRDRSHTLTRRQIESRMRDQLDIPSEDMPLSVPDEAPLSAGEIRSDELAHIATMTEQEVAQDKRLQSVDYNEVYVSKSQAINDAIQKLLMPESSSPKSAITPMKEFL